MPISANVLRDCAIEACRFAVGHENCDCHNRNRERACKLAEDLAIAIVTKVDRSNNSHETHSPETRH